MSEGLNGVPEEEIAKFEQQRKEHQERWEQSAKEQNIQRPLKEKLLGRNKTTADDFMIDEANTENEGFDRIEVEKRKIENEVSQVGQSFLGSAEVGENETYLVGTCLKMLEDSNYLTLSDTFRKLSEIGKESLKPEIVKNLKQIIKERSGQKLKVFYEGFRKQSSEDEDDTVRTERESLEAEIEKLAIITDPGFKRFAIRFISIEEYDFIIREGMKDYVAEVGIPKKPRFYGDFRSGSKGFDVGGPFSETNFLQYLDRDYDTHKDNDKIYKPSWYSIADQQTQTHQKTGGVLAYDWLKGDYRKALKKIDEEQGAQKAIEAILSYLEESRKDSAYVDEWCNDAVKIVQDSSYTEKLKDKLKKSFFQELERNKYVKGRLPYGSQFSAHDSEITFIVKRDAGQQEIKEELDRVIDRKVRTLQTLGHFLTEPAKFLDNKGYRNITSILYNQFYGRTQYQIALVFGDKSIKDHGGSSEHNWGSIGDVHWGWADTTESENPGSELLGAISIIPDKYLTQEIADMSKNKGGLSHPVFDSSGRQNTPSTEEILKFLEL